MRLRVGSASVCALAAVLSFALPACAAGADPLLAEIDSLICRGDYAAALARIEKAAVDAALADYTDEIVAARRVCDSLAARRKAVRRAVETHLGKDIELRTTKGKFLGKVQRVADEGADLLIRKKIPGMGTIETRARLKWTDLASKQEDELAHRGGWKAEGRNGAVALAYVALARDDRAAAGRALADAGEHPLAARVRRRIDAPRREAAERAARLAWKELETRARTKVLSASQAKSLLERIAAFERKYADTDFAATVARKLAAMKARTGAAHMAGSIRLGLVGWWKFDEGRGKLARDWSGRGNHGNIVGAKWTKGRIHGALAFDRDDIVTTDLHGFNSDFSWAAWIKSVHPTGAIIANVEAKWSGGGKSFFLVAGRPRFEVWGVACLQGSAAVNDGTWHHVVVTADFETLGTDDTVKIYVDGRLDASERDWNINKGERAHRIRIGHVDAQGRHFTGSIDEVRVYRRTLSAEEVAALYQAGAFGK